jgi:hypothetical protein
MGDEKKVGASWWRETLGARFFRRPALLGLGLLGGSSLLPGCHEYAAPRAPTGTEQAADEVEVQMDTLELQRRQGWNVGGTDLILALDGATEVDVAGSQAWRGALQTLAAALAPAQPSLLPYYVPTLFQSLCGPASDGLRAWIRPLHTPAMDVAFAKGQAIASLFEEAGLPSDTMLVIDLPGAESVAVAAALAPRFDPVFTFANWPHPLGVVPSHETLAGALYYLPAFDAARAGHTLPAPPMLVLDSARLNPYTDENGEFDNRYLARIPTADALAQLGIKHVLYVVGDESQTEERDDLNESFQELQLAGVDVKILPLSDFQESPTPPPAELLVSVFPPIIGGGYYYYGGSPFSHLCFWLRYHWHHPIHGALVSGPPAGTRLSHGHLFHVAARATAFGVLAARGPSGFGAVRPVGFGRVSVFTSRATAAVTGIRSSSGSGTLGRSGSLGRFHAGISS